MNNDVDYMTGEHPDPSIAVACRRVDAKDAALKRVRALAELWRERGPMYLHSDQAADALLAAAEDVEENQ